ncbi:MAG: FAD-binding oxidoreductase [Pseudomonadota bacterium]
MTTALNAPATQAPEPALIERFTRIVGEQHALTDPDAQLPYLREWRDQYIGKTPVVLRPGSAPEVAAILKLAHDTRTPVVPQSGNTGLVGGQIPHESGHEVVLSTQRLNKVRAVDPSRTSMVCEAGVTLEEAHAAARAHGRMFALSLPSKGSCRIGGNLATNAGGVNVLAYGNARQQVLGLEVALADGRLWDGLRALKKDNTGYDLKDLFIGSEGTLGIITAAVLKLLPQPAERATAVVALASPAQALDLFMRAQDQAGADLTAFELMARLCIELAVAHVPGCRDPLAVPYPWYTLIEISSLREDGRAQATLESVLGAALDDGVILDAAIAQSERQAMELWRPREGVSEAQKPAGGNIKHDVSVPIAQIPAFITAADAAVKRVCPDARPIALGHFGDGNVHYNVIQPPGMERAAFLARWDEIAYEVHGVVTRMGGSISAEHGIGRLKRRQLAQVKAPVELEMMRAIKRTFDPNGILNPGKLL